MLNGESVIAGLEDYTGTPGSYPKGEVNNIKGEDGKLSLSGWAYDPDAVDEDVLLHIYVGGPAGSDANHYEVQSNHIQRTDFTGYSSEIGDYHGFDLSVSVSERGSQEVYVYALDSFSTDYAEKNKLLWSGTVEIQGPNFRIENGTIIEYLGNAATATIPTDVTAIGPEAFKDKTTLQTLVIPSNITTIGDRAFAGCTNLKYVVVPESVTNIGDNLFESGTVVYADDCSVMAAWAGANKLPLFTVSNGEIISYSGKLENVEVMPGITAIGVNAFRNNQSVKTIVLPDSVISIGTGAFEGCTGLTGVNIPAGIIKIEDEVFKGCTALQNFTIPYGIITIGKNAFQNCTGLTQMAFPGSVQTIDQNAFAGCTNLKNISLPDQIRAIRAYAFGDCGSMSSVILPAGEISLGGNVFSHDTVIIVSRGSSAADWALDEGYQVHYLGESDFTVVDGVLIAYTGSERNITIPSGVTKIGEWAFKNNMNLTSVVIPDGVTIIGYEAFSGCTRLTNVTFPSDLMTIEGGAFSHCSALTDVTLPDGLLFIDSWAFEDCIGLTSIIIPDGAAEIGKEAFKNCALLADAYLPASITFIGDEAFPSQTVIHAQEGSYAEQWAVNNRYAPNVIPTEGFSYNEEGGAIITEAQINAVINWANQSRNGYAGLCGAFVYDAFEKATGTTFWSSRAACAYGAGHPGCTTNMLKDTKALNNTAFSDIPRGALVFYGSADPSLRCDGHVGIYDGNGNICDATSTGTHCQPIYNSIGSSWCYDSNNNRVSGTNTYKGWTIWSGYSLPSGKEYGTLNVDGVLDGIQFGSTENYATFDVYINGAISADDVSEYWNNGLEAGTTYEIKDIRVFPGYLYKELADNSAPLSGKITGENETRVNLKFETTDFIINENHILIGYTGNDSDIIIPDGVTGIGEAVFSSNCSIESVTLPVGVTSIGNSSFAQSSLKSIILPEGLQTIGKGAFYDCQNLLEISLPKSVTTIEDFAFEASSIRNINLPENLNSIGTYAFWVCPNLKDIKLPDNLSFIGKDSFSYNGHSNQTIVYVNRNSLSMNSANASGAHIRFLDDEFNPLAIDNGILYSYTGISDYVEIPEGVNTIAAHAFEDRYGLLWNVTFTDEVHTIGDYAFKNCTSLNELILLNDNISIGENVFIGSPTILAVHRNSSGMNWALEHNHPFRILDEEENPYVIIDNVLYSYTGTDTSIEIPAGVTKIAPNAFSLIQNLRSITLPDSLTEIGEHAFLSLNSLEKIFIPDSVIFIGNEAFYSEVTTIWAYSGSYAAQWAQENRYTVHLIGEDEIPGEIEPGTLNVDGLLDGLQLGNTENYGTFDVFINGSLEADDVTDYWNSGLQAGTSYEIGDIKSLDGHIYKGLADGSASLIGTITAEEITSVNLEFISADDPWGTENSPDPLQINGIAGSLYDHCQTTLQGFQVTFPETISIPTGTVLPFGTGNGRIRVSPSDNSLYDFYFSVRKCVDEVCNWVTSSNAYLHNLTMTGADQTGAPVSRTYAASFKYDDGTTLFRMNPRGSAAAPLGIDNFMLIVPEPGTYAIFGFIPYSEREKTFPADYKAKIKVTIEETSTCPPNTYWITWIDGNGNTLLTEQLDYGAMPVYSGEIPTKTATAQYTYTFNGTWSPEITSVTEAAIYKAQFDSTVNKYKVTFVDEDGETILKETAEYEYGTAANDIVKPEDPVKGSDEANTYVFSGWTPEITAVTGDVTYKAVFTGKSNVYTVTFDPNGGTGKMSPLQVSAGHPVSLTANAFILDDCSFLCWNTAADGSGAAYADRESITLTSDLTLYAQWGKATITENQESSVDVSALQDAPPEVQAAAGQSAVSGVELTNVQSLLNSAAQQDEAFGNAAAAASEIDVLVNVDITPKDYVPNVSISFKLDPKATITATDFSGNTTTVENVKVTNDMIDRTKPILVSIYTGFYPVQIVHYDDDGNMIAVYIRDFFTYHEDTGFVDLYIDHFSVLMAQSEPLIVTVTFNSNVEMAEGTMEPQRFTYGTAQNLNPNAFTYAEYAFKEWNTEPDGTGTAYANAASISTLTENTTLYAQWTEDYLEMDVKFFSVRPDGSYGVPDDVKQMILRPVILLDNGREKTQSAAISLEIKPGENKQPIIKSVKFSPEIDLTEGFDIAVKGLPSVVDSDIYFADGDAPQYSLSGKAQPNPEGGITVWLLWNKDIHVEEVTVIHALPEDEIGAYAIGEDGVKEYLLFQTYDICMNYLGSDELCRGSERCFHKEK